MADIARPAGSFFDKRTSLRWQSPFWLRHKPFRPYCRPTRRLRIELATVTINSIGTGVTGGAVTSLTPVPPISNCLGKLVVMFVGMSTATPTISSVTGATYFLAKKYSTSWLSSVWIKNGEAAEPTPTVNFNTSIAQGGAFITVLDITGGIFPTIAADGDGVLSSSEDNISSATQLNYPALTVVGGGFAMQFSAKATTGAGWTFTSNDVSGGYTAAGNAVKTTGASNIVCAAQLKTAATVFGVNLAGNLETINTNSTTANGNGVTVEFSTAQASTAVNQGNRIYILP
jgi:hypothetical protein